MILAAGLGTRLRPLTDVRAKPLVPVGDRPALAHTLDALRAAGLSRFVVNAHHLPGDLHVFARRTGVAVSEESDLLGTAGGVARAGDLLGEGDVVVWNGDVVADIDVRALVQAHESAATEATLVVRRGPRGQGNVGIGPGGRIVRLRQQSFGDEAAGGEFLGVQVLGRRLRALLPDRGCLVGDLYIPALGRGASLRAVEHVGFWHDIGTLGAYLEANLAWLRARAARHWLGEAATVEGPVELDGAVLGAGASATGEGRIARCVVWPGASVRAPLSDAIVLPGQVVSVGRPGAGGDSRP
jgi:mannose-1-phosphate guanylyltransferase